VLAMVAPLLLAAPLGQALAPAGPAPERRKASMAAALALAFAAAALVGLRASWPLTRADGPMTPAAALDHVPPALREHPVFNTYGLGGYLIFRGVKPFVDGRNDMYGDAFMARYLRIEGGDEAALAEVVAQDRIDWSLTAPGEPVTAALDQLPGWRRIYADRYAVVHVRDGAMPTPQRPLDLRPRLQ
jgi:hypothetical protein